MTGATGGAQSATLCPIARVAPLFSEVKIVL